MGGGGGVGEGYAAHPLPPLGAGYLKESCLSLLAASLFAFYCRIVARIVVRVVVVIVVIVVYVRVSKRYYASTMTSVCLCHCTYLYNSVPTYTYTRTYTI